MARSKFPSDEIDRLMLRMPAGLRDRIATVAKTNNRSMNAEIVARLQHSLDISNLHANAGAEMPSAEGLQAALNALTILARNQEKFVRILEEDNAPVPEGRSEIALNRQKKAVEEAVRRLDVPKPDESSL